MKAGSGSRELVADHPDFVIPSYGWRDPCPGSRALAVHERRLRLEKCVARRSELELENTRTSAELSRTWAPALKLRELSPEMRVLLRKLGALAIELAEIDREVAMLTGSHDPGQLGIAAASCGAHAR
ncbi:MAG TPA: hypothetical protein VMH37_14800 [Candidatus Binataceae bacterium]|nr:hypothetical protein [Candidatus Binataceae bacterium]